MANNFVLNYTGAEINRLLEKIELIPEDVSTLKFLIVDELPIKNIDNSTIYLIKTNAEDYEEYIYINNKWELLGTTKIDLTDYATKEYVDANNKEVLWVTLTKDNNAAAGYTIDKNPVEIGNALLWENRTVFMKYRSDTSEYMWEIPLIQFTPSANQDTYVFFQKVDGWACRVVITQPIDGDYTLEVNWGENGFLNLNDIYSTLTISSETWLNVYNFLVKQTNYAPTTVIMPYNVVFKDASGEETYIDCLNNNLAVCRVTDNGTTDLIEFVVNELDYDDEAQRRRIVFSHNARTKACAYSEYSIPMVTEDYVQTAIADSITNVLEAGY